MLVIIIVYTFSPQAPDPGREHFSISCSSSISILPAPYDPIAYKEEIIVSKHIPKMCRFELSIKIHHQLDCSRKDQKEWYCVYVQA